MDSNTFEHLCYRILVTSTRLKSEEFLRTVLKTAVESSASDNGGVIAFWGASEEPFVGCSFQGSTGEATATALQRRRQELADRSVHIFDTTPDTRVVPTSRSVALIPLRDGKASVGCVQLEHSSDNHYCEELLGNLSSLLEPTAPCVCRLFLRERMNASRRLECIGGSAEFLTLERNIRQAARYSDAAVLLRGERGSGKEIAACALHYWSLRNTQPFLPILCSALGSDLTADELFGHERYSFTGAVQSRPGKLMVANRGTVFLDEIADLDLVVQSTLLRTLETGEIARIGSDCPPAVDIRFVAATNRDLQALMADGKFRQDLYDRVSAFEIAVPPLRNRKEDIPFLASHYLKQFCHQNCSWNSGQMRRQCANCDEFQLAPCATSDFYCALQEHTWPGNVRELRNMVMRVMVAHAGETINVEQLPQFVLDSSRQAAQGQDTFAADLSLETAVRQHLERVLRVTGWNQSRAAKLLGLPLSTMRNKLHTLGITTQPKKMVL